MAAVDLQAERRRSARRSPLTDRRARKVLETFDDLDGSADRADVEEAAALVYPAVTGTDRDALADRVYQLLGVPIPRLEEEPPASAAATRPAEAASVDPGGPPSVAKRGPPPAPIAAPSPATPAPETPSDPAPEAAGDSTGTRKEAKRMGKPLADEERERVREIVRGELERDPLVAPLTVKRKLADAGLDVSESNFRSTYWNPIRREFEALGLRPATAHLPETRALVAAASSPAVPGPGAAVGRTAEANAPTPEAAVPDRHEVLVEPAGGELYRVVIHLELPGPLASEVATAAVQAMCRVQGDPANG